MKKVYIFEVAPPYDPQFSDLTRDDLDEEECKIYDSILPKLNNSVPDQLLMLAAYAYAAGEFKKAIDDPELAAWLRRCMIYARNGIGLWKPEHVSLMELLVDASLPGHRNWPPVDCPLKREWQFGED